MSQYDNDLKPGDLIRAYHKGFWRVTHVERRRVKQHDFWPASAGVKVGDEVPSLIHYELVMDSAFRVPSGKRPAKRASCDARFCEKVTPEWVDEQARKAAEGWLKLRALV